MKGYANLIDVRAAAEIIGVTTQRIFQLIQEGKIEPVKLMRKTYFERKAIENYMAKAAK